MVSLKKLQSLLPVDGNEVVIVGKQDDKDIIKGLLSVHNEYARDYDKIAPYFDTGDIYLTSYELWLFLKNNFKYHAETIEDQTVRSPGRILDQSERIDCKHYSLFIAGVLDAIKRKHPDSDWNWAFRFASYTGSPVAGHVFVVVIEDGNEIWIDPVLDEFDQDKEPNFELNLYRKPMALVKLSGVEGEYPTIWVNKKQAESDFLTMLNANMFSSKELLLSNSNITFGPLKQWYEQNGLDFQNLLNILYSK